MKMDLRISIKDYRRRKNLKIKLVLVQFVEFSYAGCATAPRKSLVKIMRSSAMPLCFDLARTCDVPCGRDAARRGRHEFALDGSGRDCAPT